MELNIENAICPRCHIQLDYKDMKATEQGKTIFRCSLCSKPVIIDGVIDVH